MLGCFKNESRGNEMKWFIGFSWSLVRIRRQVISRSILACTPKWRVVAMLTTISLPIRAMALVKMDNIIVSYGLHG